MKRLPIFAGALALGFLLYALNKKTKNFDGQSYEGAEHARRSHHVTDVFAKAKKVATPDAPQSPHT